jgi:hypothetical protein
MAIRAKMSKMSKGFDSGKGALGMLLFCHISYESGAQAAYCRIGPAEFSVVNVTGTETDYSLFYTRSREYVDIFFRITYITSWGEF